MAEENKLPMQDAPYTEAQKEYREVYLRSNHWQEVRKGALKRAGHRCQVCNRDKQLDVHHRTYENKGREEPGDVTVLCRKCHDVFHGGGKVKAAKNRVNWSTMSREDQDALASKVTTLLADLAERRPMGLTAGYIASNLGIRSQIVGSCLVSLSRSGIVQKKSKKRWRLKEPAESIANWVDHFQNRPFRSMRSV